MATITPTITITHSYRTRVISAVWTGLTESDSAAAYTNPGSADRSVQITGTFGGATVTVQGSNDLTNYGTLHDPLGNALSATAAVTPPKQIAEITAGIKPVAAGGTGQTLTITVVDRRARN